MAKPSVDTTITKEDNAEEKINLLCYKDLFSTSYIKLVGANLREINDEAS